jgi:hypothetical protein
VHARIEGDTFLPKLDLQQWRWCREDRPADAKNAYPMSFIDCVAKGASAPINAAAVRRSGSAAVDVSSSRISCARPRSSACEYDLVVEHHHRIAR